MAPRSLRYARAAPRSLVSAPVAVSSADVVAHAPTGGCFGGGSSASAAPPPERVPLSPLDTFLFVRMLTIPVAFFYATKVDEAALATSLSRTLARFPLVAGARTQARALCGACIRLTLHLRRLRRRAAAPIGGGAKDPVLHSSSSSAQRRG
jgi:hypothetical protein